MVLQSQCHSRCCAHEIRASVCAPVAADSLPANTAVQGRLRPQKPPKPPQRMALFRRPKLAVSQVPLTCWLCGDGRCVLLSGEGRAEEQSCPQSSCAMKTTRNPKYYCLTPSVTESGSPAAMSLCRSSPGDPRTVAPAVLLPLASGWPAREAAPRAVEPEPSSAAASRAFCLS